MNGSTIGTEQNERRDARGKSPALAGIMSSLPGMGQVYVGLYQRGFIHISVVAALITLLNKLEGGGMEPFFGLFLAFFWIYNIVDAVRLATQYNDALAGRGPVDILKASPSAGRRGSLLGGLLLILAGFLFFLHTKFDVPMDWLQDWWPVIPIGLGIYLVSMAIKERKPAE